LVIIPLGKSSLNWSVAESVSPLARRIPEPGTEEGVDGAVTDQEVVMGLFGDRYVGEYEGHTVELLRNNWNKTLKLLIDGEEVASTSCDLPLTRTLEGSLEHGGVRHDVVARSVPHYLIFSQDSIAVDGNELPLTQENPRGLLKAVFKAAGEGHLASVIVVGALVLLLVVVLVVGGAALMGWLRL
jgi:hypothetical protein